MEGGEGGRRVRRKNIRKERKKMVSVEWKSTIVNT